MNIPKYIAVLSAGLQLLPRDVLVMWHRNTKPKHLTRSGKRTEKLYNTRYRDAYALYALLDDSFLWSNTAQGSAFWECVYWAVHDAISPNDAAKERVLEQLNINFNRCDAASAKEIWSSVDTNVYPTHFECIDWLCSAFEIKAEQPEEVLTLMELDS